MKKPLEPLAPSANTDACADDPVSVERIMTPAFDHGSASVAAASRRFLSAGGPCRRGLQARHRGDNLCVAGDWLIHELKLVGTCNRYPRPIPSP
jgi:hypothetical protein